MTNDLYRSSYRHLDIEPGSTWQEVRRAYKRSVKKWHPDHFHNDTQTLMIAAEKIKEINCAFDLLSTHYRTHGTLPLPGEPLPSTPPETGVAPAASAARARQQPEQPVEQSNSDTHGHETASPGHGYKRSGVITRLILVVLVAWLGYSLWFTPTEPPESPAPAPRHELPSEAPAALDTVNNRPQEPTPSKQYFTFGSTVGDVYAIQGVPSKTSDNLWYYGKSKVYFDGGKVVRWEDDPTNPLRASADTIAGRAPDTVFGIGSTKAQVRAVQGQPLSEWPNVWEYGTSKVYFDGDRVKGWYDSTLNPLQVRK